MSDVIYLLLDMTKEGAIRRVMGVFTSLEEAKDATDSPIFTDHLHITSKEEWREIEVGRGTAWERGFTTQMLYSSTSRCWRIDNFYVRTPYGVLPQELAR